MKTKALGLGVVFCISGVFACGGASALTAADWVGTYAGSDTVSLTDGGTGTVMFDVQVAAGDIYNSVSVGNLQDDGVIFNPFQMSVRNDGLSAATSCGLSAGQPVGIECNASLKDRRELIMTGKDCSSGVTFSVSATKK